MKIFIGILFILSFGMLLWQGLRINTVIQSCNVTYQDDLNISRMQETTSGNHTRYCNMSQDTLTSWEDCVTATNNIVPIQLTKYVRPIVIRILHSIGDSSTSLQEFKLEHDNLCKDEIDYMFYPPVQEK